MTSPIVISVIPKNARESVLVALSYRGADLVDIRVLANLHDPSGGQVPTKKGVSLRIDRLPMLVSALQAAEAEARGRGLLIEKEDEEIA